MAAGEMNEKKKLTLTIVAVVAVNLLLGGLLYYAHSSWAELDKSHKKLQGEVRVLDDFLTKEARRQDELTALQERYKSQESKLPAKEVIEQLITEVSAVAERNKVRNVNRQFVPQSGVGMGAMYERNVWRTKWEGSFFDWVSLMNEMEEHFKRFVSFEGLMITPKNSGVVRFGTAHDISVDLVTYRFIAPQGQP